MVAARPPWPPYTGDRLRTGVWVEALAPYAQVTLLAPGGTPPAGVSEHVRVVPRPAPLALPGRALQLLRRGWPLTALLAGGLAWREAMSRAARRGPFQVSVVVLARTHPWVAPYLTSPHLVLDAIDSLAANVRQRAGAAKGLARWWWRWEANRTATLERQVMGRYQRVVVVAEEEAAQFPGPVEVVSHGVELGPPGEHPRDVEFAFWGRLAYFANRDAAAFLLRDLWPAIRARLPRARLLVAGADCPREVRAFDGRDGVWVVSPMADRAALLRRVRVALFPMRWGSGQPNKVLEAAEASCAVVSTPIGARGVGALAETVVVAPPGAELVEAAVALAGDTARCRALGERARQLVATHFDRRAALRRFAEIAGVAPAQHAFTLW